MSLRIFIDDYDGAAVPTNTTLTGSIAVELRKAEQRNLVTQVQLVFYGRSKVDITRTRSTGAGNNRHTSHEYYRSKCLLFSHSFTLSTANFQPAASRRGEDGGTLTFPFSVHIPTHAEPVPPNVTEVHKGDVLNYSDMFPGTLGYDPPHAVQPPLPLPDTMLDFHDHVSDAHRTTASASIRYTLRAEAPGLSSASKLWLGNAESDCDISIFNPVSFPAAVPLPINYNALSYDETIRTLRLLPSHRDEQRRLSFRENMRSVFKKDKLPFLTLRLNMSVADIFWLDLPDDHPLPISVSVQRLASGTSDADGTSPSQSRSRSRSRNGDDLTAAAVAADTSSETSNVVADAKGLSTHPPSGAPDEKSSTYLAPPPFPATTSPPDQQQSSISNPAVHLTRLSLTLTALTALRGNDPSPTAWGGRTYTASPSARIFEWRASKTSPQIPLPFTTTTTASTSTGAAAGAGAGGVAAGEALDLGAALGITTTHLRSAGTQGSGLGANSDGSPVQGGFALPNVARTWLLQWDLRAEVAGEEVRWRCDDDAGDGGVAVRLYRGAAGGGGGSVGGVAWVGDQQQQQQQQQQTPRERDAADGIGSDPSARPPEYTPRRADEEAAKDKDRGTALQDQMARLRVDDDGDASGSGWWR